MNDCNGKHISIRVQLPADCQEYMRNAAGRNELIVITISNFIPQVYESQTGEFHVQRFQKGLECWKSTITPGGWHQLFSGIYALSAEYVVDLQFGTSRSDKVCTMYYRRRP